MSKRRPQSEMYVTLAVVRILIASYFLAIGVGFVNDAAISSVTDTLFRPELSHLIAHGFVFACAFAVMVGKCVRGGALLLAGFMFMSTWWHKASVPAEVPLEAIWLNALLIAVLLLIALTTPGGTSALVLRKRAPVQPRRIRPNQEQVSERQAPAADPAEPATVPQFTSSRTVPPQQMEAVLPRPALRLVTGVDVDELAVQPLKRSTG